MTVGAVLSLRLFKADNGLGLRVQKRIFKRVINPEAEINRFENRAIRCNIFFEFLISAGKQAQQTAICRACPQEPYPFCSMALILRA